MPKRLSNVCILCLCCTSLLENMRFDNNIRFSIVCCNSIRVKDCFNAKADGVSGLRHRLRRFEWIFWTTVWLGITNFYGFIDNWLPKKCAEYDVTSCFQLAANWINWMLKSNFWPEYGHHWLKSQIWNPTHSRIAHSAWSSYFTVGKNRPMDENGFLPPLDKKHSILPTAQRYELLGFLKAKSWSVITLVVIDLQSSQHYGNSHVMGSHRSHLSPKRSHVLAGSRLIDPEVMKCWVDLNRLMRIYCSRIFRDGWSASALIDLGRSADLPPGGVDPIALHVAPPRQPTNLVFLRNK